jgi:hypothetical protein
MRPDRATPPPTDNPLAAVVAQLAASTDPVIAGWARRLEGGESADSDAQDDARTARPEVQRQPK